MSPAHTRQSQTSSNEASLGVRLAGSSAARPLANGVVALLMLVGLAHPAAARAQSFFYAHPASTVTFPLAFGSAPQTVVLSDRNPSSREFVDDDFGDGAPAGFPPGMIRMAANLNQRYRVIGNPYMFYPTVRFTAFNMDSTAGTTFDRVYFDQFYASSPMSATGAHAPPFGITPTSLPTTVSMTWPGFVFRVATGADRPRQTPPLADGESWGFIVQDIQVAPSATIHDAYLPTFSPYESIIGVLNANDDVVRGALIPNSNYAFTIAAWNVAPNNPAWGVAVWARCGADPGPGVYDAGGIINSNPGAFLELGPCPSQWRIAFTNVVGSPQTFRATIGAHFQNAFRDVSHLKVGIAFNATSSQLTTIRERFREAAWRLYGTSGGTQLLRSFEFYNNSTTCGSDCDYHIQPASAARDTCTQLNSNGRVYMYEGADPSSYTLAHESSHCELFLEDEYRDDSAGVTIPECLHSLMGISVPTFCTAATHRITGDDEIQGASIPGPYSYGHDGPISFAATQSVWEYLYNNSVAPVAFPGSYTPDSHQYLQFFDNPALGRFDRLQ